MTEQPTALRLAEYWENCAKYLQTWVDENEYVEFCYHPERLKKEQADQQCTAAELRRLHEELQEQCRINGMGAEREARLMAVNQELVKVLKPALEAIEACLSAGTEAEDQDASDKLCDARAAIRKALEQPAQKRPQNCGTGYCSCIECLFEQPNIDKYLEKDNSEQPAQQQEPFGYFKAEPFGWTDCAETDEGAIALYERPQPAQPSKPWVGLTDVDRAEVQYEAHKKKLTPLEFMELHETKLREKNA